MTDTVEKKNDTDIVEEKENIIVEVLKKLLEINWFTYGGKKEVLK